MNDETKIKLALMAGIIGYLIITAVSFYIAYHFVVKWW